VHLVRSKGPHEHQRRYNLRKVQTDLHTCASAPISILAPTLNVVNRLPPAS
jgi:hypothetical protein